MTGCLLVPHKEIPSRKSGLTGAEMRASLSPIEMGCLPVANESFIGAMIIFMPLTIVVPNESKTTNESIRDSKQHYVYSTYQMLHWKGFSPR